jgi:RND family efflux transporter MFP subunit
MHRLRFLAALAALLLITLPFAAPARAAPPGAAAVPTVVVGSSAATPGFELDGTVQALQQSMLAAQVSGNVTALLVKSGDRVRAGQPIARIDERDLQAALARGEAGVAQAEAELRNARVAAERTRQLRGQNFVSQAALDTADTQLEAAEAGARQAAAARSQAALARSFAGVTAPFDAVVLATHVEAGDLAAPGRPIATLYAPGRMRAVVQVPSSRSAVARTASRIEVQLPDGRWVEPVARAELPGADAVSQTVEWRLDLPAAAAAHLVPGVAVRVRFAGAKAAPGPERLTVPAAAILRRGELTAVYAVQSTQFVLKPVRLGARAGDSVEVLAGLRAGERIALDPVRAGLAGAAAQ